MFTSVAVDSSSNDRRTLHYLSQLVETADTNSTPDMCRVRVKSSEVRTPRSRALSADFTVHEPTVSEKCFGVSFFSWLHLPVQISAVLSAFNFKLLAAVPCPISSIHCLSRTPPLLTASGWQCNRTCVSSAYEWRFKFHLTAVSASSAVYKIKNWGPQD